jgi:hypothetical protein
MVLLVAEGTATHLARAHHPIRGVRLLDVQLTTAVAGATALPNHARPAALRHAALVVAAIPPHAAVRHLREEDAMPQNRGRGPGRHRDAVLEVLRLEGVRRARRRDVVGGTDPKHRLDEVARGRGWRHLLGKVLGGETAAVLIVGAHRDDALRVRAGAGRLPVAVVGEMEIGVEVSLSREGVGHGQ